MGIPVDQLVVADFAGEEDAVGVAAGGALSLEGLVGVARTDERQGEVGVGGSELLVEDADELVERLFAVVAADDDEALALGEAAREGVGLGLTGELVGVDGSADHLDGDGHAALTPVVDHVAALHDEGVAVVVHAGSLPLCRVADLHHHFAGEPVLEEGVGEGEVAVAGEVDDVGVEHRGAVHPPEPVGVEDGLVGDLAVDEVELGSVPEFAELVRDDDLDLGVARIGDGVEQHRLVRGDLIIRGGVWPDEGDLVATVDHPVVQKAGVDGGAGLDGNGGKVCEDAEAHGGGLRRCGAWAPQGWSKDYPVSRGGLE